MHLIVTNIKHQKWAGIYIAHKNNQAPLILQVRKQVNKQISIQKEKRKKRFV